MRAAFGDDSGGVYVEFIVSMVILLVAFAMLLTIPPVFIQKQNLDSVCRRVTDAAAETGSVGTDTVELARQMLEDYGLTGEVSFSGSISPGSRVQLRDRFTTVIKSKYVIRLGELFGSELTFDIDMASRSDGIGRRYFK